MEIPKDLKSLYRHWDFHTSVDLGGEVRGLNVDQEVFAQMQWFIRERMKIWGCKTDGRPLPYTDDVILQKYRFCNIYREFDRQTIEFHRLLNPLRDNFPLWLLNMFYCRMIARTETISEIGLLSFDLKQNEALYQRLIEQPRPKYGTPYVFPVSVILKSNYPTRELFIAKFLPQIMPQVAALFENWQDRSVVGGLDEILPVFGFNLRFLWTEVLIDIAYQWPEKINLFKQFPIGPGALPTLRRLNPVLDPEELVIRLVDMNIDSGLRYHGRAVRLSAENWEGVCCEFRKYTNLKSGKGRRRLYKTARS